MLDPIELPADGEPDAAVALASSTPETVQAWEEIESGRYMPRRIRGSFRGGHLG